MTSADLAAIAIELHDIARRLEADRNDATAITYGMHVRIIAGDVSDGANDKRRAECYREEARA